MASFEKFENFERCGYCGRRLAESEIAYIRHTRDEVISGKHLCSGCAHYLVPGLKDTEYPDPRMKGGAANVCQ